MASANYQDTYKALLISNWTFDDDSGLPPLRGPRYDIESMYQALTHEEFGLFAPGNVTRCADLGRDEVMEQIDRFLTGTRREDYVLIYYSGHGIRKSGNLHLAVRHSKKSAPWTGISMGEVGNQLDAKLKTDRSALILDCCYSGDPFGKSGVIDDIDLHGRWALSSSSAKETSKDSREEGMPSRFTEALVKAILDPELQPPKGSRGLTLGLLHEWLTNTDLEPVPEIRGEGASQFPIVVRRTAAALLGFAPPAELKELTGVDELIEVPVELAAPDAAAVGHVAELLELVGRGSAPEEEGAVEEARATAWEYLTGTLRRLAVNDDWLSAFRVDYTCLKRLRLCTRASDEVMALPWEYMSIETKLGELAKGPLGLRLPVLIERAAPSSSFEALPEGRVDRVALLGMHPGDLPLAAEVALRDDLEHLGVDVAPEARGSRLWFSDMTTSAPAPVLVVLAALRRSRGVVHLWLHKTSRWVTEEQFVEQLRSRNYDRVAPHRVIVIEAFPTPPALDALGASAHLASSLAACGLGHVVFLCHTRAFSGYTQVDSGRPTTFIGNLVHALNNGATIARAFYVARRHMQQDFPDCEWSFGIPGLYALDFAQPRPAREGATAAWGPARPASPGSTGAPSVPSGSGRDGLDLPARSQGPPLSVPPRDEDVVPSMPPSAHEMTQRGDPPLAAGSESGFDPEGAA